MSKPMPTVGEQLRRAREAQNLSIHQLAETTKLKTDHLRALETGDYNAFSAPVYIRGSVRSTATALKLNVPQIIAELDAELAETEKYSSPPCLAPHSGGVIDILMYQLSKIKWRWVLPLAAILLTIGLSWWAIAAWQAYRSRDPLANLGPGIYTPPSDGSTSGDILTIPKTSSPRRP